MYERWGYRFGKLVPKVKPKDIAQSWRIFKGDTVRVMAGKDSGKQGEVLKVLRNQNKVVVKEANIVPGQSTTLNIEKGIDVSNVALVDPITNWRINDKPCMPRKVRVSKDSGNALPWPKPYVRVRKMGLRDTTPDEVLRVTFRPDIRVPPIPADCSL